MSIPNQITFADVENIGLSINPKPKWLIVKKGFYWCPYCNWTKNFKRDKHLKVKRCESCGITDKEYYVKLYNNLF